MNRAAPHAAATGRRPVRKAGLWAVTLGAVALAGFAASQIAAQDNAELTAYYTAEQAERGERAFLTNCSGCHGYQMVDSFVTYRNTDDFHSLISLTMPWEDPGMLPAEFYIDMVAYMLREAGYPAGDDELPIDRELLSSIVPTDARAEE